MANKIVTLWSESIAIHFIKRIKRNMQFLYVVEVENISNDEADYDMSKLTSPYGINILKVENFELDKSINEDKLLLQGHIKVKEKKHKGIVGFIKNDIATNAPIVFYEGYKIKVNFIERLKKLHG